MTGHRKPPPKASLHFRYSAEQADKMRQGVLLDWQAAEVRESSTRQLKRGLLWMGVAFFALFIVALWGINDDSEEFVTWLITLGVFALLVPLVLTLQYWFVFRPIRRRRIRVRRGVRARVATRGRWTPILRFGSGLRRGQVWRLTNNDARQIIEGTQYDVYFLADRLFYLELTPD